MAINTICVLCYFPSFSRINKRLKLINANEYLTTSKQVLSSMYNIEGTKTRLVLQNMCHLKIYLVDHNVYETNIALYRKIQVKRDVINTCMQRGLFSSSSNLHYIWRFFFTYIICGLAWVMKYLFRNLQYIIFTVNQL